MDCFCWLDCVCDLRYLVGLGCFDLSWLCLRRYWCFIWILPDVGLLDWLLLFYVGGYYCIYLFVFALRLSLGWTYLVLDLLCACFDFCFWFDFAGCAVAVVWIVWAVGLIDWVGCYCVDLAVLAWNLCCFTVFVDCVVVFSLGFGCCIGCWLLGLDVCLVILFVDWICWFAANLYKRLIVVMYHCF